MKLRWFALAILTLIAACSICIADATDDRVNNVQQKLGLTDVKTAYLKQVLLEPVPGGTRLDQAEVLVELLDQRQALSDSLYVDSNVSWGLALL